MQHVPIKAIKLPTTIHRTISMVGPKYRFFPRMNSRRKMTPIISPIIPGIDPGTVR